MSALTNGATLVSKVPPSGDGETKETAIWSDYFEPSYTPQYIIKVRGTPLFHRINLFEAEMYRRMYPDFPIFDGITFQHVDHLPSAVLSTPDASGTPVYIPTSLTSATATAPTTGLANGTHTQTGGLQSTTATLAVSEEGSNEESAEGAGRS